MRKYRCNLNHGGHFELRHLRKKTICKNETNAESIQSNIKENKCKGTHFEKRGLRQIFVRINGSRTQAQR